MVVSSGDTTEPMCSDDSSSDSEEDAADVAMREEEADDNTIGGGDEVAEGGDGEAGQSEEVSDVYLPGRELADDEELVVDETAYVMLHQAQTGDPCLSFDVIEDRLGENREEFPLTMYLAAGTQSARANKNKIIVMKISNLVKTNKSNESDDDGDGESSDEDDDEKLPDLETAFIKHPGCVNRIRCATVDQQPLCASWSERGRVHVWQLSRALNAVDSVHVGSAYTRHGEDAGARPVYTFSGHSNEGFALDWSRSESGVLGSGDCDGKIHVWRPAEAGVWSVDQQPLADHSASVEDLQWSPNERSVLASCSVDKSLRVWDVRAAPASACMIHVPLSHRADVNVISWSSSQPFLVSGADDGTIAVWDLRTLQSGRSVAVFKHHSAAVTSVEWHPQDSSVFASSGADDQLVQWDLSVENDDDDGSEDRGPLASLPPQLLFIHQGQREIKELHWHRQLPGCLVSTALSGFNVLRTISV